MPIDLGRCRKLLDSLDLEALFIECLGWDRHKASLTVLTKSGEFRLRAFAQKRGFAAFVAPPDERGRIPDSQTRAAIDWEVSKVAREHIVIFTDGKSEQVWLWVRRTKGQPTRYRVYGWRRGQPSGTLLERVLPNIAFALAEEERLTLPDVTTRAGAAFDVEKVTKRFFERFQTEHKAFHGFIKGIKSVADRNWYASVMLNRLMFCYFIQKKGLLDGDHDYLRNRLARLQQSKGKDQFWSFYRHFLLRLFHEGLGQKRSSRAKALDALVGRIPYLNGGLFDIHELERTYPDIQIPDDAFERLFAFFDEFRWHLDERPLHESNEINPDVLGYIFEKYINQKQMGAYYTKEDITGYISQNTILPFILDRAARDCAIAFAPDSPSSVWRLLRHDPDAYIYEPVRHGVVDDTGQVIPLPKEIEAGTSDVAKRGAWNKAAPAPFGLPTESWREHVSRRERCFELRRALAAGEVTSVNDLVTLNLDIRQFVEDLIDRCEGPELLRAVWRCLVGNVATSPTEHHEPGLSVLDPTCGSGAFLFAALNILEPLYEACLDRMESFLEDVDRARAAGDSVDPRKFADFKATLAQVAEHPNQRYYILKSIIVNNLYGVDIMEEACEICKLRLFLKLVAQVDEGVGAIEKIEPLPDIDFNIRAGNTLVGFTSLAAVRSSMAGRLDFGNDIERIEVQAVAAAATFQEFRGLQTRRTAEQRELAESKRLVRERFRALEEELNRYLASECGVATDNIGRLNAWISSHQPFHWFVDFYGIVTRGGFDVIIGNPPYTEIPKSLNRTLLRRSFSTVLDQWSRDEDIYTCVVERSWALLSSSGRFGMILPLSVAFSTKRPFVALREQVELRAGHWWWSHFDRIPSALFGNEVRTRCTIALLGEDAVAPESRHATTALMRWEAEARPALLRRLSYARLAVGVSEGIPKIASQLQADALSALQRAHRNLGSDLNDSIPFTALSSAAPRFPARCVFVGGTAYNWFPAWREIPTTTKEDGAASLPARTIGFRLQTDADADAVFAMLCSSLGYWWWAVASDGFNLKRWLIDRFPLSLGSLTADQRAALAREGAALRIALRKQYVFKDNKGRIGNFFLPACQNEILAIDGCLAQCVPGLTPAALDNIREFNAAFSRAETDDDNDDEEP